MGRFISTDSVKGGAPGENFVAFPFTNWPRIHDNAGNPTFFFEKQKTTSSSF
jgi:hypothetical protein